VFWQTLVCPEPILTAKSRADRDEDVSFEWTRRLSRDKEDAYTQDRANGCNRDLSNSYRYSASARVAVVVHEKSVASVNSTKV
jgi:hypothetical protein